MKKKKFDWQRFWLLEIGVAATTLVWYGVFPQHGIEPRIMAMGMCTIFNLIWVQVTEGF